MTWVQKDSRPIDGNAARVARKGIDYRPDKKVTTLDSAYPIEAQTPPPQSEDLTGVKFGRFVVVGYYAKGGKWVCKCSCGRYAIRRTKAIFNKENTQDRCQYCRQLAFLKREDHWRRTGKDVDIRNF